jgi:hypothetical protein
MGGYIDLFFHQTLAVLLSMVIYLYFGGPTGISKKLKVCNREVQQAK